MERKLASIAKIVNIEPIEGADVIVKATVRGWDLVTQKSNDFKPGDLVCYFEIDSLLPVTEKFEFLRKSSYRKMSDGTEGFRLKTIKLRGQISQGLILPLSEVTDQLPEGFVIEEDADLTEILNVTKWDPAIPVELSGTAKGNFPSWIPKTDEERAENMLKTIAQNEGISCTVCSKIEGSSFTGFLNEDVFGVCSRNFELEESDGNTMFKVARELKLEEKLRTLGTNMSLQGEIYGEGIQGNKLKIKGQKIMFFNAYNIDRKEYLHPEYFLELMKAMDLEVATVLDRDFKLVSDIDLLRAKANHNYPNAGLAEGIVIRSNAPIKGGQRLSFKVINQQYLLKNDD